MVEIKLTSEQLTGLQNHVQTHLMHCVETLDMDQDVFVTEEGEIFEPYGPYCGCETCNTREQLVATFKYLENNKIAQLVLEDEE